MTDWCRAERLPFRHQFTLTLSGTTINGTAGRGILIDNTNATYALTISVPISRSERPNLAQ